MPDHSRPAPAHEGNDEAVIRKIPIVPLFAALMIFLAYLIMWAVE